VVRAASDVERRLTADRLEELNRISGAEAYEGVSIEPGVNLAGRSEIELVRLSLAEAVRRAVENNLDLSVARLSPRIAEQRLRQAQAVFDATLFADVDWQKLDTPQPAGSVPGLSSDVQEENFLLNTGLRKRTRSGGTLQLDTTLNRTERVPSLFAVNSFYNANLALSATQPLLDGFGRDVNEAEIVLARNAIESEFFDFQRSLEAVVLDVVRAYWELDLSQRSLLIQQRLLERTVAERDRLEQRAEFDVSPVRITEANSRVELRRADLIRARSSVREASDQLKRLLNAEDLPLIDEAVVLPTDDPTDAAVRFSLIDAVTMGLRQRPELAAARLAVDDAAVRQRLADNALLPQLDLNAAIGLNGLDVDEAAQAYEDLAEGDYIDYVIGLSFAQPLGNEAAEALLSQRQLERQQAVIAYRARAQDVVLEIKNALRDVLTSYELVGATRAARWAAADSLRSINVQEDVGVALTDEFLLDLKLNAQERLADAEFQEAQALANYTTAIAALERAKGTLVERYGVSMGRGE
jgi:outer membrane protein TolC